MSDDYKWNFIHYNHP